MLCFKLTRGSWLAKMFDAVEGQKVGVVIIVRAASFVIKRGAAYGDQVVTCELPVHILKAVTRGVGVVQQLPSRIPVA